MAFFALIRFCDLILIKYVFFALIRFWNTGKKNEGRFYELLCSI